MSLISKKSSRQNTILNSKVFLVGLAPVASTIALTTSASADSTGQATASQTGTDGTKSGYDLSGQNTPGAGSATDAASNSDAAKAATQTGNKNADSNTQAAGDTTKSNSVGWVDVYVDHSAIDDAITKATGAGVNVVRDPSVVQTGDETATVTNTNNAKQYYATTAQQISDAAVKYQTDLQNWQSAKDEGAKNTADVNAQMAGLRANLASQGQTSTVVSKPYDATTVANDTANIQASIAAGKSYNDTKTAIDNFNTQQNSSTLFQTAAAQGDIKLSYQNVTVKTASDLKQYQDKLQSDYQNLQTYLAQHNSAAGSSMDKPTFTLTNVTIDQGVIDAATKPVETYTYTAPQIVKPAQPTINYHYIDIRSQQTGNASYTNTDGGVISLNPNNNAGGKTVAQALVNQVVGINTDNQPLPSGRFDKIQNLTIQTVIPANATYVKSATATDPTNWTTTYDEDTRTVTQTATPSYLVQINLNQADNNTGSTGGTVNGEWKYNAPQVAFKLDKDNTTYQTHSTTIVNNEYQYTGAGIQIRTDSANPSKVNENSQYQQIDGKSVLPGSTNNYVVNWDLDQYRGVNIDSGMQANGLSIVDEYPSNAVDLTGPISIVDPQTKGVLYTSAIPTGTTVGSTGNFSDASGKAVQGLSWKVIDANSAPDGLKGKLTGPAIVVSYNQPNGDFYKNYVQAGHSLQVVLPMTTKKLSAQDIANQQYAAAVAAAQAAGQPIPAKPADVTNTNSYGGNSYSNVAWQSDYGNNYQTNTVTNDVPTLNPTKNAVLSLSNLQSLDSSKNTTAAIQNGSQFDYQLNGSKFPTNLSEDIKSYVIKDSFDSSNDEYDGQFNTLTNTAIQFKNGSTLALRYPNGIDAGSDISKYVTQTLQRATDGGAINTVSYSVDNDFLSQIDYTKTNFNITPYMLTKRIQNTQGVKNEFHEIVNGVDYGSNVLTTNSTANALDVLQQQVDALKKSQSDYQAKTDSSINTLNDNQAKYASALSVVVKTLTDTQNQVNQIVQDAKDSIPKLTVPEAIASLNKRLNAVQADATSQVNQAATTASNTAQSNPSGAVTTAQTTGNQIVNQTAQSANSIVNSAPTTTSTSTAINNLNNATSATATDTSSQSASQASTSAVSTNMPTSATTSQNASQGASTASSATAGSTASANNPSNNGASTIAPSSPANTNATGGTVNTPASTDTGIATMIVFDPAVKTQSDAINFANTYGSAIGASTNTITSVSQNADGKWVVKFKQKD